MLLLATMLLGIFIFGAAFRNDDVDEDDDGPGGGMMIPVAVPSS